MKYIWYEKFLQKAMRSRISNCHNKMKVTWNDVNKLPAPFQYILRSHFHQKVKPSRVTLAIFPQPKAPTEHHPTQTHKTCNMIKIIKCIWYINYSKKLCDLEFPGCLLN